jgi:hypothetical protein
VLVLKVRVRTLVLLPLKSQIRVHDLALYEHEILHPNSSLTSVLTPVWKLSHLLIEIEPIVHFEKDTALGSHIMVDCIRLGVCLLGNAQRETLRSLSRVYPYAIA